MNWATALINKGVRDAAPLGASIKRLQKFTGKGLTPVSPPDKIQPSNKELATRTEQAGAALYELNRRIKMKLEVGKTYITNAGGLVKPVHIIESPYDVTQSVVCICAAKRSDTRWGHGVYSPDGISAWHHSFDIVTEVLPYHDFKIGDPVISSDGTRRYFAGVTEDGTPLCFGLGRTVWTSRGRSVEWPSVRRPTVEELES